MLFHPNFLFAHLEKTGGTFVENFLTKNIKEAEYIGAFLYNAKVHKKSCRHDSIYEFQPYKVNDKAIKFGYIRNPYDWYLSFLCFLTNHRGLTQGTYDSLFENVEDRKDLNVFVKSLFAATKTICYYTNREILESEKKASNLYHIDLSIASKLDIGLLTYRYLYIYYHHDVFNDIENYNKYFLADKILRFENLTKDLANFFDERLTPLSSEENEILQNSKKIRETEHEHYSNYYIPETIDLIRHKDRIIFDIYDYKF